MSLLTPFELPRGPRGGERDLRALRGLGLCDRLGRSRSLLRSFTSSCGGRSRSRSRSRERPRSLTTVALGEDRRGRFCARGPVGSGLVLEADPLCDGPAGGGFPE